VVNQGFSIGQTVWLAAGEPFVISGFVDDEDDNRIGVRLSGFPPAQFFSFTELFAFDPGDILEGRSERIEPDEGFVTQEQLTRVIFLLRRELSGVLPAPGVPALPVDSSSLERDIDALRVQLGGLAEATQSQFQLLVDRVDVVTAIIETTIVPQQLVFLNRLEGLDVVAREVGENSFQDLVNILSSVVTNPLQFLFDQAGDEILDGVFDGLTR